MTTTEIRRPGRVLARHDGPVALAAMILTGSADLRGAACTANPRLFDPDVDHAALGFSSMSAREAAVAATCQTCPARGACWAWASGLNSSRVTGPTAYTAGIAESMRQRRRGRPRQSTPSAMSEDPAPVPSPPRPTQRRGTRSRVRPSIHRKRRRS